MALTAPSRFLYGYEITPNNSSLDFRAVLSGPILQATITLGYYSLTSLMEEIKRQMQAVDTAHVYTVSADRSVAGGTQVRVSIQTNGTYLDLLFASGPRTFTTIAPMLGFLTVDRTGSTSYQSQGTSGIVVITTLYGYNYLNSDHLRKNFGVVNVSASGQKETITFGLQRFWQVQFKYIPSNEWNTNWVNLMTWMIRQRRIEFCPEITSPNTILEGTLESTGEDGKGLAYRATEMLPDFPNFYDAGLMRFRVAGSE